jgi:hypothetical protein
MISCPLWSSDHLFNFRSLPKEVALITKNLWSRLTACIIQDIASPFMQDSPGSSQLPYDTILTQYLPHKTRQSIPQNFSVLVQILQGD